MTNEKKKKKILPIELYEKQRLSFEEKKRKTFKYKKKEKKRNNCFSLKT